MIATTAFDKLKEMENIVSGCTMQYAYLRLGLVLSMYLYGSIVAVTDLNAFMEFTYTSTYVILFVRLQNSTHRL